MRFNGRLACACLISASLVVTTPILASAVDLSSSGAVSHGSSSSLSTELLPRSRQPPSSTSPSTVAVKVGPTTGAALGVTLSSQAHPQTLATKTSAAGPDALESSTPSNNSSILRSNVVILTNNTSADLLSNNSTEYVFSNSATQLSTVSVGDILLSDGAYPFMINVTSITSNSSEYVVLGNQAPLSTVLAPGNYTWVLDPTFSVPISNAQIAAGVSASGSIGGAASAYLSISWCGVWIFKYPCAPLSFGASISESASLSVTVTGQVTVKAEYTIAKILLGQIPIGPGLWIDVEATFLVGASVSTQATFAGTASVSASQSVAVTYEPNGSWVTNTSFTTSGSGNASVSGGSDTIQAYVTIPQLDFCLDGVLCPYVAVQPQLSFTANASTPCTTSVSVTAALSVSVGVEVDDWVPFIGGLQVSFSWTPWSQTIASWSISTCKVTFSESGLPSGKTFAVTFDNQPESVTTNGKTDNLSFTVSRGGYGYSIPVVPGWQQSSVPRVGNLTVDATMTLALNYTRTTYSFGFTESGLASGTSWSVSLNGSKKTSTGSTISFNVPNGTYSCSIGSVAGYTHAAVPGSVAVSGSPVSESVAFTQYTYTVTFTETGLATGTSWSVTLNGVQGTSTSASIALQAPNGTSEYTLGAVPGYVPSSSSGSVKVAGAAASVTVSFTVKVYTVTFTETGLASSTSWSVTLNGVQGSSSSSSISFSEPNGSYPFTVAAVSGFTQSPASGTISIAGGAASQEVSFTPLPSYSVTFTESGVPSSLDWCAGVGSSSNCAAGGGAITISGLTGSNSWVVDITADIVNCRVTLVYTPSPSSGTVSGSATIGVTFTETEKVVGEGPGVGTINSNPCPTPDTPVQGSSAATSAPATIALSSASLIAPMASPSARGRAEESQRETD